MAQPDLETVRALLEPLADPERAKAMSAYMKGIAPFLGIPTPVRRASTRLWIRGFDPGPQAGNALAMAAALFDQPHREFAYVGIDLLVGWQRSIGPGALAGLRDLAMRRPWWDTVDAIATLIGRVGLRHEGWDARVAAWASDPALWVRRIALIFQVGRGDRVDLDLLFAACLANAQDSDFFMRKGIGWGLRDAARSHPAQVADFVAAHHDRLSALSIREATKHL